MGERQIYVETRIHGDLDTVWHRTQDPREHARWDLRFTEIVPLPTPPGDPQRFRYSVTVPGLRRLRVDGVGVSAGERTGVDGGITSALRFVSDSRLSPISAGSGYWRYVSTDDGVRFLTGYRYEPGVQGRRLDDLFVRSLVGAMTAWSFDRLRLWVEHDLSPEAAMRRSVGVTVGRALLSAAAVIVFLTAPPPTSRRGWVGRAVAVPLVTVLPWVVDVPVERPRAGRALRRAPDALGLKAPDQLAGLRMWQRALT